MNDEVDVFEVELTDDFKADIKRFVKKKKFVNLPNQIQELVCGLKKGDFPGVVIKRVDSPLKHEIYKLRLPNIDTNEGKSNGYRVYYSVMLDDEFVLLITIYYKKETESISENYIDGLIEGYLFGRNGAGKED